MGVACSLSSAPVNACLAYVSNHSATESRVVPSTDSSNDLRLFDKIVLLFRSPFSNVLVEIIHRPEKNMNPRNVLSAERD